MELNYFKKSRLSKLVLQEINCKKLKAPSKDKPVKVSISVGLKFDDKKTKHGYNTIYNMDIKCEEDGEGKLFFFESKIKAVYQIDGTKKAVTKGFEESYNLFLRELYNTTREDINAILDKMNVHFQLPLNLPDELKIEVKKEKK